MKSLRFLVLLVGVLPALAQGPFVPVTANRVLRGAGAPANSLCAAAADVGKVYINRTAAATFSTFYVCANTGSGTYAWELGGGGGSSATAPYVSTFTGTTVTVTAATHGQGIHPYVFTYDSTGQYAIPPFRCKTGGGAAVGCAGSTSNGDLVIGPLTSGTYSYAIYGATGVGATGATGATGPAGAGATSISQLTDCNATKSSATVWTFASGASATAPCLIRHGQVVAVRVTSSFTVTISGMSNSGTLYLYESGGVIFAGHNTSTTLTCSAGCQVATGISAFPAKTTTFWALTWVANVIDTITGGMDYRALLGSDVYQPGTGISMTQDPTTGFWTIAYDPAVLATLASPTFTGTVTQPSFNSTVNCSSSASPAVCTTAAAGSVAIPTGVTSVALVVNTSAVTANSQIFVASDDTLGTKLSVTCNSTLATLVGGLAITARTAGTSFTVTYNGTIATNPLCVSFLVVN